MKKGRFGMGIRREQRFRAVTIILLTFTLLSYPLLCIEAYASNAQSLDEVTAYTESETTAAESNSSNNNSNVQNSNDSDWIKGLSNAADLSGYDTSAIEKGMQPVGKGAAAVVYVLCYGLTVSLGIFILLDVVYMAIPPLGSIMANGHQGAANQNGQQGQQGGYNSGFGGGGFGGGYNSGFGGGGFGGGYGAQNMNQNGMGGVAGRSPTQWVSDAALNSVATAKAGGGNKWVLYIKECAILCIGTSILIVLARTGILVSLGLKIMELAMSAARNFLN